MRVFFSEKITTKLVFILTYLIYPILVNLGFLIWNIPAINIISNIVTIFIITFNYKSSLSKKIASTVIIYFFFYITEIIITIFTISFDLKLYILEISKYSNINGVITVKLLTYIIALLSNNLKKIKWNNKLSFMNNLSIIFIPSISTVLMIVLVNYVYLNEKIILICIVFVLLINILVFYIYDELSKSYLKELEYSKLKNEREYYYQQFRNIQESNEEILSIKHDIKNQLSVIKQLIDDDNNILIKQYMDNLL